MLLERLVALASHVPLIDRFLNNTSTVVELFTYTANTLPVLSTTTAGTLESVNDPGRWRNNHASLGSAGFAEIQHAVSHLAPRHPFPPAIVLEQQEFEDASSITLSEGAGNCRRQRQFSRPGQELGELSELRRDLQVHQDSFCPLSCRLAAALSSALWIIVS